MTKPSVRIFFCTLLFAFTSAGAALQQQTPSTTAPPVGTTGTDPCPRGIPCASSIVPTKTPHRTVAAQ